MYEPAVWFSQPAFTFTPGAGVPPAAGLLGAGFTIALAGILMTVPGYGNWLGSTHALYASKVVTEMLYFEATEIGESPA